MTQVVIRTVGSYLFVHAGISNWVSKFKMVGQSQWLGLVKETGQDVQKWDFQNYGLE